MFVVRLKNLSFFPGQRPGGLPSPGRRPGCHWLRKDSGLTIRTHSMAEPVILESTGGGNSHWQSQWHAT